LLRYDINACATNLDKLGALKVKLGTSSRIRPSKMMYQEKGNTKYKPLRNNHGRRALGSNPSKLITGSTCVV
jgi:hypothetical protein